MTVTGGNKKCLFLSYFWIVVRKKDMAIKPVKNVFFNKLKKCILLGQFLSSIMQHTDGQLCILHPDECRCL